MRGAVFALCAAQVLTMIGVFAFPTLLPAFTAQWSLSATEAGWISGVTFAAYAVAVPVLTAATDRLDARLVHLGGSTMAALSCLGFALLAEGFWSALALRALGGAALAGTYMPGLKALVDRTHGPRQPRWISFYTASFSLGTSASFLVTGWLGELLGWRAAYGLSAAAALAAVALVGVALRPVRPQPPEMPTPLLDFRPVLRNRPAMGYVLAYCAHTWELFGFRNWQVAFLAVVLAQQPGAAGPGPAAAATLGALVAMAASIGGADLAQRFDRRRLCMVATTLSGLMALALGFLGGLPYGWVVAMTLVYSAAIQLDSAALTTGAVLMAEPGRRGATIAVHSLIGFGGGFVGPLAVGALLDASGGSWGLAFASLGVVALLGPLALRLLR